MIWGPFGGISGVIWSSAHLMFPSHGVIHSDLLRQAFQPCYFVASLGTSLWSDGVILYYFHQSIKGEGQPVYSLGVTLCYSQSMQDSGAE